MTTAQSYIYYFKCPRPCKLEFAVFSWKSGWDEKFRPFCPECGKQVSDILGVKGSDKQIFALKSEILKL